MKFLAIKNLYFKKLNIPKVNENVLIIIAFLVLGIAVIETYKYPGLFLKHLSVSSEVYYSIFTLLTLIFVLQEEDHITKTKSLILSTISRIEVILIPTLLIAYSYLHFLEGYRYSNYVFSHYHINLNGFNNVLTVITIMFVLHIAKYIKHHLIKKQHKLLRNSFFPLISLAILIPFVSTRVWEIGGSIIEGSSLIFRSLNTKFDDRFEILTGHGVIAWGRTYAKFVNSRSEPNSTIFIPPTVDSWQLTGNLHYMQSELFPRKLVQDIENVNAPLPQNINYIMISYGEWMGKDKVWPKHIIPKEKIDKIYIIDRYSLEQYELKDSAYIPNYNQEVWGLIKLK